ncbi:MAG: aminotransferase class V-fold PLP-dependent enzyme [Lachnospiraceae bacterium]|nr:aminotransferase class V-fold PLP-dependent enzyme [Lachnospiraceae bacterium]
MNQNTTPLLDAIDKLIETRPAYFRIPGHRLTEGVSQRWTDKVGKQIFAYDVTETPYTDDLHSPEGPIAKAQELLSELYQSDESYFLVNGTTCGNEAMILSSAVDKEKLLVARNAHKSAMMGMIMSGAEPCYVMPEVLHEWGIQGGISPQSVRAALEANRDCKAFFMVSPTYYGVVSDVEEIAKICHEYGAMLLVDEAHGGHVYFHEELPKGALQAGADMCVQSMHKVTGALTQSSVLHVKTTLPLDNERLVTNLHLVQSTSPNYLLMTSLDCARYELAMHGGEMQQKALELARSARERIRRIEGFDCMGKEVEGQDAVYAIDETRLVISAKGLGLGGYELEELLFEKYAVNMELADSENVLAIITYANEREDIERLIRACEEISREYTKHMQEKEPFSAKMLPMTEQVMTPREAYFAKTIDCDWNKAVGEIAGEMIAPYPPGIPIVYPGERITQEIWNYLEQYRLQKCHIHGSRDGKLEVIKIIK